MADGLSIPGLSDKYKTNELVEALMASERIPLNREEANLKNYQKQQDAWRSVNQKMSTLRDTVKSLYSFENPFSNKLTSSSDENAITVDANRDAEFGTFKIDVLQVATGDRFLSDTIEKDYQVKAGKYTFKSGDKTVEFNWKGGKLTDFVNALNKRSNNLIKANLINISASKKSLLIESLKTGQENSLVFENDALEFTKEIGMINPVNTEVEKLDVSYSNIKSPQENPKYTIPLSGSQNQLFTQDALPKISKNSVNITNDSIEVKERGGIEIPISQANKNDSQIIEFEFSSSKSNEDITKKINEANFGPQIPDSGGIDFKGISISNNPSETSLSLQKNQNVKQAVPVEISDNQIFFIKNSDGSETQIDSQYFSQNDDTGKTKVSVSLRDFPDAQSLVVRNENTGKTISLSIPQTYDISKNLGFVPKHPVENAKDAKIKYEGITLTRPTNDIDDVIPSLTLHLHDKTEKSATIKVESDTESAKDAIITFIGKYNQTLAEMNVLTTNKPEIISELDYLSDDERETYTEKLGMFQGDFTLSNGKSALQSISSAIYRFSDDSQISMLNQIGISTNARTGTSGYNASQLRGYLECDEKKLDEALKNNLTDVKNLFGYDSDGDFIIDNGLAYQMDQRLTSWVQSGGIIASKTNALESNIKQSNAKIARLQTQLDQKEAELKSKYANMEGTLNSLESQQNSLNNFSNQGSRK